MSGVDLTKDGNAASRLFTPRWKPAVAIIVFVLAFKYFGGDGLALPLWSSIAALALTFATNWKLRRRAWFWIVMSVFIAAHVLAIVFAVHWENWVSVKGFVLLPVLDWLAMIWMLAFARKTIEEHRAPDRPYQRPRHAANGSDNPK